MSTVLYVTNAAAPYSPATFRGTWNDTTAAVTKALALSKVAGGALTSVSDVAPDDRAIPIPPAWNGLCYRGVSAALGAQTVSGTLDVLLGVYEDAAAADICYHLHAYVTQGDSDTVRGTLLSNYLETTSNEWGTSSTTSGKGLASAQTLTNVSASAGDRIVVEVGFICRSSLAVAYTGTVQYGTTSGGSPVGDLTVGGDGTALAGFLTFSANLTFAGTGGPSPFYLPRVLEGGMLSQRGGML